MGRTSAMGLMLSLGMLLAGTRHVQGVEPLSVEWIQKGGDCVPFDALRQGTATLHEVETWTSALRGSTTMECPDLDADGEPDLLAEMIHARGATGNRSYLAFLRGSRGYRFLGMTERIGRCLTYVGSGRSYLIQVSDNGPGANVSLWHIGSQGLVRIGRTLDVRAGDMGLAADRTLYRDLTLRTFEESRLLACFAPLAPEGRIQLDPRNLAPTWEIPGHWSASEVAVEGDQLRGTITSTKPLSGFRSKPAGKQHVSRFAGTLVHLRGNSYVVLLPDVPDQYSTAHIFIVLYREANAVRFVFSQNLLEAENS